MDISFDNSKLRKLAHNPSQAVKKLGPRRAQLYKQRLDELMASKSLEDVRFLPGNYHELTGNRKGQWSCNLDNPYRLIFEPHESPIPKNEDGQYIPIRQ